MTIKQLMTADDLLAMPDDGRRYELVRGELRTMPPSGGEHGRVTMRSSMPLALAIGRLGLGEVFAAETGFRISRMPDTIRAPDFAFLRGERWESLERRDGYIEGAPDLAVEVVSPSDSSEEVHEKALEWLDAGVRLLWVLHPRTRTVTVYTPDWQARVLGPDEVLDGGDVVPGFSILVRALFE